MAVVPNHLTGKVLQHGLIPQVTGVIASRQQVDGTYPGTGFLELLGDGFADAFCAAGNDDNFVFKHGHFSFLFGSFPFFLCCFPLYCALSFAASILQMLRLHGILGLHFENPFCHCREGWCQ